MRSGKTNRKLRPEPKNNLQPYGDALKTALTMFAAVGALLFASVLPLSADEASERRLGEEALAAGDFHSAVKFFANARQIAGDDAEKWAKNTLSMAEAKLRSGDVDGAKQLLSEYRNRFPARAAGMLPGRILMTEKHYGEAEKFFASMAAAAADPGEACAAGLGVGESRLRRGDFKGALEQYERLENENSDLPEWARRAHEARIFTLLEAGRPEEAAALLKAGKFRAADPEQWSRLELLYLLRKGEFDQFRTRWEALRKQGWKNPAPILHFLASEGAKLAAEKKNPAAEELWKDAFDLAGSDPERQTALRELINLQAASSPAQAAETVRRYLDFFPDAPDRTGLLMRGARLLVRAGDGKQAVDLYSKITGDNRIPASSRLIAAREAAVAADEAGMFDVAETMLRYLIDQADTPVRKEEGRLLLGEHFYRRGNYAEAAALMQAVAADNGSNAEAARFWLLQSLIPLKRYDEAAPVAEKLRDARDPRHRIAAEYFRAFLLEKRGQAAAARSEYERFLVLHPDSGFAPAALLSAAELALALRDFTAAADGFFRYAALKPTPGDAPRALYLAMQAGCFGNRTGDIDKALKLLESKFPDSAAGIEARLQLADYLQTSGDNKGAEAQLALLEKRKAAEKPEIAAEILFRRAAIAASSGDPAAALALLNTLLKTYPTGPFAADAAMTAGNLEADAGRYQNALAFYTKARELRPSGLFGRIAAGRIADTRYSIYAETLDPADLKAAAELYEVLAEDGSDPRLRLQSLYKLGKCRELSDDPERALEVYNRVLYLALDQKRNGVAPDPVWTGKAAYAAALAYLKPGTPAGARNAQRVIWILEELQLPTGEDFARIRQEIERKYKLQRKP